MSLRTRILLTVAPLLLLTAILGAADVALLLHVGRSIDDILRDNLRSVDYMVDLNRALDDVDDALRMFLRRPDGVQQQFDKGWAEVRKQQDLENHNITIHPDEDRLAKELGKNLDDYRLAADEFLKQPSEQAYGAGPKARFLQVRETADAVRLLNEKEMQRASAGAQWWAAAWCVGLAAGLLIAALLAALLAWTTLRAVLGPLGRLAHTADAVGAGNLNVVIAAADDEIGQVAHAFNQMIRQLRDYRQSHSSRLLRAQRTGQAVLDSFPDPILVLDPGGAVDMANPAARRVLGVSGGDPRGEAPAAPEPWQPPEPLRGPIDDALRKQQPFFTQAFDQTIGFRLDGEERAYLPQILPIRDPYGDTLGAAVVLSDVTRFRLLDQIKSDLAATVSHELKTPLTGVRLALHLLLEETVGPLTPKQTELLVDARDNAERLLKTIEHLLALARLEHGGAALDIRPEEPQSLLQTAADALRPRAVAKRVELVVEASAELPAAAVDAQRFGLALGNLLDNALAHTDEGGRITLSASALGDDRVRFSVTDTGLGIPPEYLPHLFEKFFRVPGRTQSRGTGLGLAIVREIVTAHHGEVVCESQPGKGAVFRITVPVWRRALALPNSGGEGSEAGSAAP
ncbi:MAG TPA: ATP-binding protein [Gemmataceae bacterium]|nr:ATP-binding protein [Gemmataceae bacterium]